MNDHPLFAAFHAATLPKEALGHPEHVRLGYLYLARYPDLAEAALEFRRALKRFTAAHGVEGRYHETLTWAYLALVQERMRAARFADSVAFVRAHPELLDHRGGALARHYDVAAITASPTARETFVLPHAAR